MKKIAIIAPKKEFFGASIVQFPFYQSLRAAYPEAHVEVWSKVKITHLFKSYKLCDGINESEKKGFIAQLISFFKFRPDIIINMKPYSFQAKLISLLVPAKKKIHYTTKKNKKGVYQDTQKYIAYSYLDLLKPLGIKLDMNFDYFQDLIKTSSFKVDESKKHISLIVAGGEEYKKWGIENFLRLTQILGDDKIYHFILGSNETKDINAIKAQNKDNFIIHDSKSIEDLASLCQQSKIVISNDCGPSHIAQLSHCKYLGLWGWGQKPLFPRFSEWFYPRKNSFTLMTKYQSEIKELAPSEVAKFVDGIIE